MKNGILKPIRILDLSRILAGPYATRLLADFGAEVIKLQSHRTATGAERNDQPYFKTWNRNKHSITLDMNKPRAHDLLVSLVAACDVVVENFSPRVMANWDLTYQRLNSAKSDLILVSMSGMGQDGPWRDRVAYGPTVQALGGLTYLTAFDTQNPLGAGFAYADVISGLYAVLAILAALEHRDRTGQGMYIDLSEYEAVATLMGPALMAAMAENLTGTQCQPCGNADDEGQAVPQGCYPCQEKESWCTLSICTETQWQAFCRLLELPRWSQDPGLSSVQKRLSRRRELDEVIAAWTVQFTPQDVVARLQKAGIPSAVVSQGEDLRSDPQLQFRNFWRPLDPDNASSASPDPFSIDPNSMDPDTLDYNTPNALRVDACPIRIDGGMAAPWRPAPELGADNRYVFIDLLGLTENQYQELVDQGVIY